MDWLESINAAIDFIENHLTDDITVEDVSKSVYSSDAHFGRVFNIVTGFTLGEYTRNRRLSLAGRDMLDPSARVIDAAMKYCYDTQESFSKAFSRFHGFAPSETRRNRSSLKFFHPLSVNISVRGGFIMPDKFTEDFCWNDGVDARNGAESAEETYQRLIGWAGLARGTNPSVFDRVTEWILDDSEWTDDKLAENRQILINGVIKRFAQQNARLRELMTELEPSGVVNAAVFSSLDRFDFALEGNAVGESRETVKRVFADFTLMSDRRTRELIAGGKTGVSGTDSVDIFGYINELKDADARVQWALFMPRTVMKQQKGFRVESFEYMKMPALRFIGQEGDGLENAENRKKLFETLDSMAEYKSGFDFDMMLTHHFGKCVDACEWHVCWGRFMKAGAPVPEGFMFIDFTEKPQGGAGVPYMSQFAFSVFSGDVRALHESDGYDMNAMYDVTRNIMLGQDVNIPYPDKYWVAEVFRNGSEEPSDAYMFSADLR